jgi:hypothetical protein
MAGFAGVADIAMRAFRTGEHPACKEDYELENQQ